MSIVLTGTTGEYLDFSMSMGLSSYPFTFVAGLKVVVDNGGKYLSYRNTSANYLQLDTYTSVYRCNVLQSGTSAGASTTGAPPIGSWKNVIGYVTTSPTVANIAANGETANGISTPGAFVTESSPHLYIGCDPNQGAQADLNCKVAYVAWFTGSPSAAQITSLEGATSLADIIAVGGGGFTFVNGADFTSAIGQDYNATTTPANNGSISVDSADNPSAAATYSITGNISMALSVAASAMTFSGPVAHSIIANVPITVTFTASSLTYTQAAGTHSITGNISMALGIAATLAYTPHLSYAITGNISMALTVAAGVIHYTHLLSGGKGIPGSNIFLFLKR